MEKIQKIDRPPNPRKGANFLSVITFSYTFPTFIKGFRRDLIEEDLPKHLKAHASSKLGNKLEESWKKEIMYSRNPSLWKAIGRAFGLEFMLLGGLLFFLEVPLKITQTFALAKLITYYTQSNKISESEAYMYAGLIVGTSLLNVFMGHNYMMCIQNFGMKLRVACSSLIYRKALRLSKSVIGGTSTGQMVNLLSNDVNRCDRSVLQSNNVWVCGIEVIIIVGLLYHLVGATSTVGVLFLVLFIPLQMWMVKKMSKLRLDAATKTDERIRSMTEIISGIQVIKMYTWEQPFAKLVGAIRRLEIRHIRAVSYIRGLILAFSGFTTKTAIFLTILTYVLLGNTPNAEYVYIVTSFYNILRQAMTVHLPGGISDIVEIRVSISRLRTFLLHEETNSRRQKLQTSMLHDNNKPTKSDYLVNLESNANCNKSIMLQLQNATAKWSSDSSDNTLKEINLKLQEKELIGVIGPVGCGKTSLLHVILKELPLNNGALQVEGRISYASQEPWVFAGTAKQNILFGQPMNQERYQEVVKVCALEQDFSLFPHGDETLVGERGVMLSGGQKARINLARAIYKEADIYLLDDPLSAVDTHVGKQLFDECISEFLKYKSTILVTHQLQYLQNVNRIYLIEGGRITANGSYKKLRDSGIDFAKQLCEEKEVEASEDVEKKKEDEKGCQNNKEGPTESREQRSSGHVSANVYLSYFKAGGSLLLTFVILLMFIATQLSASAADFFLAYWVNMEQQKSERNATNIYENNYGTLSTTTCIYIYSGITVFMITFAIVRTFSSLNYAMTASTKLHDNMFTNIVYAPMRFFNTNSSGRVLNRFSKDIGAIDDVLPMTFIDCLQIGLTVVGVTVLVSIVNPWLLIETGIILVLFYLIRILYLSTSRSVKRLEGITRSPVFAHLSASLQGLTTIRAYGAQEILEKEFDNHQDLHSSAWHLFLICTRAFGFWLDLICVVYMATVTFSFLIMKKEQYGGNVGLAITQALSLTGLFQWGMRQWSELENQMTSVERVIEYTKIDHEADSTEIIPSLNWPEKGNIAFKSVSLRYSLTDLYVLKQLSFSVKSKEKIGIVGRTGAGKSSLIYALFQLTKIEGVIAIDDIDVSKIPLRSLRSKISIIPQEPVLFSGTLRRNLDPFDEYSDSELWNALEEVELKQVVKDLPSGLNEIMSEGGSNFSVGQRQLVCLARAVVRKNKILVLDEATANVDPQTDALIQATIRRKFCECTVLTIAHRLHTVMDSDKILVMDLGRGIEFNHPYVLLKDNHGLLYSMVQQTGEAMAESLMKIASDSYKTRKDID